MANDQVTVFEAISVFLKRREQNSVNTRIAYEKAIRDFFMHMTGKKIEDLNEQDIQFAKTQIETYQIDLRSKYKTNTVNTRMFALKSLYDKFIDYGFDVKSSWFKLEAYEQHDKESYDPMSHGEIVEAIRLVSNTRKGDQKVLLIRLAYATAFRKESLLEMKKTDVIIRDGTPLVKALGKGNKWDYKKISKDLHDEILKRVEKCDGDKIFTLTDRTVINMMHYIRKNIDFGERNIAFHSLKKSSIEEVALITNNDLKAMQSHGNHSSVMTTMNDYIAKKKIDDLVIVDINYKIPVEKFDELSREELLHLIKNMDRNTQIKMLQRLETV